MLAGWTRRLVAFLAFFAAVAPAGCDPTVRRGSAGTFAVTAMLTQETCGPQAVPVDRVVQFRAELGVDLSRATWRVAGGGSTAGVFTAASRSFRFSMESFMTLWEADRRTGRGACVLRRFDVIDGTLAGALPSLAADAGMDGAAGEVTDAAADAGAPDAGPATFAASETIVYGPVAGADCEGAIGAGDGQFSALPCTQRYEMRGEMMTAGQ